MPRHQVRGGVPFGRLFTIQTDLDRIKDANARITHWSLMLQSYTFNIKYRAGRKNGNACHDNGMASMEKGEGV